MIQFGFGRFKSFPQIRAITVPEDWNSLLEYFPIARRVCIIGSPQVLSEGRVSFLATRCPLMENISLLIPDTVELFSSPSIQSQANIRNLQMQSLPLLVQRFPNIKDITLSFDHHIWPSTKVCHT